MRFVLTPPLLILLTLFHVNASAKEVSLHGFFILMIFLLIVSSDIVDGVVARKLEIESETGKQLDILADFFYRFSLIFYFSITGKTHYILPVIFVVIFLLFIFDFTPLKILKSHRLLYYSGRSVPFSVTILLGALLLTEVFPESYIINIIAPLLNYCVYFICAIALIVKCFCYSDNSWKITRV